MSLPTPVSHFRRPVLTGLSVLSAALAATAPPAGAAPDGIRIVGCEEKVPSAKRGVCANAMSAEDARALAPGVSWYYNWHFEPGKDFPASMPMTFLPMAWGDRPADVAGLQGYLSKVAKKPPVVLAINEPNLREQAFISPEKTANLYRRIKAVADQHRVPVVGPHMALGSSDQDSIKAMDPIEKKELTYTFMIPFLKAFNFYMGPTEIPAVALHSYGDLGELKWSVDAMYKEFNKPVWMTEYAQWKTENMEAAKRYLMQSTDFLERNPRVAGYAWFKERAKDNAGISLLDPSGSGKLSPLGEVYVNLPAHDEKLYYRIPGRLQAERYNVSEHEEINPTGDTEGFAFMGSEKAGAWLDYHLQVDAPGTYTLKLRVGGAAGNFEIIQNDNVLARVQPPDQPGWKTLETSVPLAAGLQKLRVRCEQSNQALNWIEFSRR